MSTADLEFISCPTSNCGGQWLPASKVRQLRESHQVFYCPSGHSQWFVGKSEVEKLKEQLAAMIKSRDEWQRMYYDQLKENQAHRRRQYALRGVITRLKKAS